MVSKKQQDKLEIENQTVHFKSAENMEELDDESIDVIITSPPYNRGKTYSSDLNEEYNDNLEESKYLDFLTRVWKECYRVAKNTAIFFLNIGDSSSDQGKSEMVALSAENASWIRIQDIVWIKSFLGKGHYTPSGGNKRLNNLWEHVYVFVKNKKDYILDPTAIGIPYADKSNIGRYSDTDLRDAGNVWLINYEKTTGATIKKGHDAPFPIGLPYKCIKLVPNAKRILDPFGGTCTTLAASLHLGLFGIAYEKYPRIKVIKERILEGKLFKEQDFNLLPHLELSIKLLTEILSNSSFSLSKSTNKKELSNLQIVFDVLQKLNIDNDFTKKLENKFCKDQENRNYLEEKQNKLKQKTLFK
ncbi:MAG: site-specific DNA-methyltransferase [Candidatus Lokiarchaeota archaeon]|nr:site-specific DNA-methyltransferase [Candidatus Lokiarchaeota archaeon]